MKKLKIGIDSRVDINNDIINYLSLIKGINKILLDNNFIEVCYDSELISDNLIKKEILLYLNIINIPSIIYFNKYDRQCLDYKLIIKDLCCEYCLCGFIDELLDVDGIIEVYSDFDYHNKKNVSLFIKYNNKYINIDKIKELELKFNS